MLENKKTKRLQNFKRRNTMKFLITDFESTSSTEAECLTSELNATVDHEALLISPRESIYDNADRFNPDYIISSLSALSKGIIDYLSENKNVKFLCHVTDNFLKHIVQLEKHIIEKEICCPFMFGPKKPLVSKIPFKRINKAANLDLLSSVKNDCYYKYDMAFFLEKGSTYDDVSWCFNEFNKFHLISNKISELSGNDNIPKDILLPEKEIIKLYSNYDTVVFLGIDDYIPESFFNCLMKTKTYYRCEDEEEENQVDDMFRKILGEDIVLNYKKDNKITNFDKVRNTVLQKHLGANRVKTLLSQLPK